MKLRYKFTEIEAPDGISVFTTGKDMEGFHGFLKMNHVGAAIFHALANEISYDELTGKIADLYPEQPAETVESAVREFIGRLRNAGLLEELK